MKWFHSNKLEKQLASDDIQQIMRALTALAEDPSPNVSLAPLVIQALKWGSAVPTVIEIFVKFGSDSLPHIQPLLSSPDPTMRARAAFLIGEIGDPVSIPKLIALLTDSDEKVGTAALAALGSMGWQPVSVEERVWKAYAQSHFDGIKILAGEGPGTVYPLLDILATTNDVGHTTLMHQRDTFVSVLLKNETLGIAAKYASELKEKSPSARCKAIATVKAEMEAAGGDRYIEASKAHFRGSGTAIRRPHAKTNLNNCGIKSVLIPSIEITWLDCIGEGELFLCVVKESHSSFIAFVRDSITGAQVLKMDLRAAISTQPQYAGTANLKYGVGRGIVCPGQNYGAFLPDEHSTLNTVVVWNFATNTIRLLLEGHSEQPYALCFSSKGHLLATASSTELIVWDVESGKQVFLSHLRFSPSLWNALSFADGDSMIAVGTQKGQVMLFSCEKGCEKSITTVSNDEGPISRIVCANHGATLLVATLHGDIRILDIASMAEVSRFEGHYGCVYDVKLMPNPRYVVSCGQDTVRIWDLETVSELFYLPPIAPYDYLLNELHVNFTLAVAPMCDARGLLIGFARGEVGIIRLPQNIANSMK